MLLVLIFTIGKVYDTEMLLCYKKSLKIPKGQSETEEEQTTQRPKEKEQTTIYKTYR